MIRNAFIRPVYTSLKTHNPQNSEVDPDHEQEGEEEGGVLLLALLAFLLSVIFFSFFTQNKGEGRGRAVRRASPPDPSLLVENAALILQGFPLSELLVPLEKQVEREK